MYIKPLHLQYNNVTSLHTSLKHGFLYFFYANVVNLAIKLLARQHNTNFQKRTVAVTAECNGAEMFLRAALFPSGCNLLLHIFVPRKLSPCLITLDVLAFLVQEVWLEVLFRVATFVCLIVCPRDSDWIQ